MKLFKQDYISFDGSGSFVTVSGDARESVVDDADVAYRLSRIAEEERERMTSEGTAPNAVDAADMSAYTGVAAQHAQAPLGAQAGESAAIPPAPIALAIRTVVPIARPMMTTVNICIICAPLDTAVVLATSQYCPMTNKSANP